MTTEPTASDQELVEAVRGQPDGATDAFEELVLRHQSRVLANCRYLTRSPGDAEDLAQEVFVKAYYGLNRFEGRSQFKTWLHRIKINHCLNFLDKRKSRTYVDVDDPSAASHEALRSRSHADDGLRGRIEREHIAEVLDGLADTLRVPLVLRDMDGLSYQEIADQLGMGLSAVKMRIKRGREEFRARWREISGES